MISIENYEIEYIYDKNVCYIYLKGLERSSAFSCELANLRKTFYNNEERKQGIRSSDSSNGFPTIIKASMTIKSFSFKKTINKITREEAFKTNSGFILQRHDTNSMLCCKIYYKRDMSWEKTEYFSSNNAVVASHIIKPAFDDNSIELFTFNDKNNSCNSKKLFPININLKNSQKRLIDANFNEDAVFVLFDNLMCVYCEKEHSGLINSILGNETETAKVAEKISPKNELENVNFEECESKNETIIEIPEEKPQPIYEDVQYMAIGTEYNFTGRMLGGKKQGVGRLEKINGMTIFDGEYVDDKKDGQGSLHGNDGKLLYTGNWKEDKEHGLGVLYKENDLTVSNWNEGKIGELVTTLDKFGDITYSGKIIDGKKQGSGVRFIKEKSIFVVEKFTDNKAITATVFDEKGNMVYVGGFENDMRNGYGIEFDENSEVVFQGTFKDNEYASGTLIKKIDIKNEKNNL